MIDFNTYKDLHPQNKYTTELAKPKVLDDGENPLPVDGTKPEAPEIYLFPLSVPGFDFRAKGWGK